MLRPMEMDDLPIFFAQQLDPESRYMAGFTMPNSTDQDAFLAHWQDILADEVVIKRTILYQGEVAGNIMHFDQFGNPAIGYWLGRDYWGKGIATAAVQLFIRQITIRPLYARVLKDNLASRRVLEKCGFKVIAEETALSNVRGVEIQELIYEIS
jgi:RimJ/RimL family protein N-acetyltransferase